jgi:uncharacterized protein YndB with AHSA1/START domain
LTWEQQQLLELMIEKEGLGSSTCPPATQVSWEPKPGQAPDLDVSTVIALPPEEVFEFTTDLRQTVVWLKGLVEAEPLSSGPIGAGSRWRYTRRVADHVGTVEVEVIRHEGPTEIDKPPYRHWGRTVNMGIEVVCRYTFDAEGDGATRVRMELFASAQNLAAKLLLPMVVKTVQELDIDQLDRLKSAMEGSC